MMEIIQWIGGLTTFGLVLMNGLATVDNYKERGKLETRIRAACSKCSPESEDCRSCDYGSHDDRPGYRS